MNKKYFNYDIVFDTLCLSICVYNYEENGIDENRLRNSFECDYIVDDLLEKFKKFEFIKCYKNTKGVKSLLNINHNDKNIYLTFKGSDNLNDLLNDIKTIKTRIFEDDDSSIHSGFSEILINDLVHELILKDVIEILKNYNDYNLYITGHSLGGSLAILFSYYLSKKIKNDINIITFGSPRVGDFKFYENFNKISNINLLRICNDNDIIITLPKINYYHVGDIIQLNEVKCIFYKNEDNSLLTFNIFTNYSISDHFCKNYYINIVNNKFNFDLLK